MQGSTRPCRLCCSCRPKQPRAKGGRWSCQQHVGSGTSADHAACPELRFRVVKIRFRVVKLRFRVVKLRFRVVNLRFRTVKFRSPGRRYLAMPGKQLRRETTSVKVRLGCQSKKRAVHRQKARIHIRIRSVDLHFV